MNNIRKAPRHRDLLEETSLQLMRISINDIRRGNMGTHHPCNAQASSCTKMKRRMLNITYRERKTNIWVREKTKVTDVIEQVRRRKWTWAAGTR
ncbi:hypothetical protein NP493_1448g00020 [Ridgeia piscesae]|uniref:Uncharacterized protein n=1 Tax=Ridgeia piscesae TaxID=27915 RepID=A0AAD9K2S4_RIDPI|nr:hypothetical protein NP493_1448g00020 [Ridgeia piscesae]